ncbi:hypothetical protein VTJ49DRAFT_5786 [Mycothermus thermophilus]|uniref:Uncharacterized protein n=1 Tax=Humicola insolens TaxID=85995 RepID=A0ABR3VQ44_HUMIN
MNVQPSFRGFIATTFDAALLIQAAINNSIRLHTQYPGTHILRDAVESGDIYVYLYGAPGADSIDRWRDGLSWTPRRSLKNGFNVYRQVTNDPNKKISADDAEFEELFVDMYYPYLGPTTGCAKAKANGLVKKTITFIVNGNKYGIAAYYDVDEAIDNLLLRPRHTPTWINIAPPLMLMDFWQQDILAATNAGKALTVDNDNGIGATADHNTWKAVNRVLFYIV